MHYYFECNGNCNTYPEKGLEDYTTTYYFREVI